MIRRLIRRGLRRLGYDIVPFVRTPRFEPGPEPPPVHPVWPLPRAASGLSDEEIRREFARHPFWHYAYEFEGGLRFDAAHIKPGLDTNDPRQPLQRFRHFMPWLVQAHGGSLRGKRVLDIACNSGFWSLQCALLGADVVGFDGRPELIEQARLLQRITGVDAEFRVLDFRDMSPERLGGTFDIVLNLGFLYHVAEPVEALERTRRMARTHILLDTSIHPSEDRLIHLRWEEPFDIRAVTEAGMVAFPTRAAVELMLRHLKFPRWIQIPIRTRDLPQDDLTGKRAAWLIDVSL